MSFLVQQHFHAHKKLWYMTRKYDKRRDMDDNMLEMQKEKKAWKEDDAKDVDLMLWYYMQYVKEDHPLSPPLLPLLSTLQPSER